MKKLLYKLKSYGINGLLLSWVESFLSNRVQKVRVGNCLSDVISVTSGVPQGSVLGPILFIIYINNICDLSERYQKLVTFKLFADDVKVYSPVNDFNSVDQLQTCLNDVARWADDWQLKLSPHKCCVLQCWQ